MADRWGEFDSFNGATASELAQQRTDAKNQSIRRKGQKIKVMSNEEYDRLVEQAAKKAKEQEKVEEERREKLRREYEKELLADEHYQESKKRIERESQYVYDIQKTLGVFHEPAEGDKTSDAEWKVVYEQTAPFLAKCVIAYRYGVDKDIGKLKGRLGELLGKDFKDYLDRRRIPVAEDESGFETLVSQKV